MKIPNPLEEEETVTALIECLGYPWLGACPIWSTCVQMQLAWHGEPLGLRTSPVFLHRSWASAWAQD